jgi:hypothetical protein
VPLALGSEGIAAIGESLITRGIALTGESLMEVSVAVQEYSWEFSDSYRLRFKVVMPLGLQTVGGGLMGKGPPAKLRDSVNVPSGVVIKEFP